MLVCKSVSSIETVCLDDNYSGWKL